jgi:hypothetical protein
VQGHPEPCSGGSQVSRCFSGEVHALGLSRRSECRPYDAPPYTRLCRTSRLPGRFISAALPRRAGELRNVFGSSEPPWRKGTGWGYGCPAIFVRATGHARVLRYFLPFWCRRLWRRPSGRRFSFVWSRARARVKVSATGFATADRWPLLPARYQFSGKRVSAGVASATGFKPFRAYAS